MTLKISIINQTAFPVIYSSVFLLIIYKVLNVPITHDEVATAIHYSNFSLWEIMMYPDAWPSNHILNTLFAKGFINILGNEQWAIRISSLLSFFIYSFGVYRIIRTILGIESRFFIAAALLFIANPYMLDFFGLCRGYGLSTALCTLSVSYMISGFETLKNKHIYLAFGLSLLASYANFSLLVFWLSISLLSSIYFFLLHKNKNGNILKPGLIIFISCILYLALIITPLYKMQSTDQFKYWASSGFINETIIPLIKHTIYGSKLLVMYNIFAFMVICLVIANSIFIIFKLKRSGLNINSFSSPAFVATLIILLTAGINIIQCLVLNTPNLNGRTALFFYPLFITTVISSHELFYNFKLLHYKKWFSFFIILICLHHIVSTVKLKSVKQWEYDANTLQVLNYIDNIRGSKNTSLATHWLFNPSFNYYHYTGNIPWLDLKPYNKALIPDTDAEFYYILSKDYLILNSTYEPVMKFNKNLLLRKKTIPISN